MPKFEVGQEWTDGWFNFIIVKVEEVPTVDEDGVVEYVTTFDSEGIFDRQPAFEWAEYVSDELKPVDDWDDLAKRLMMWRDHKDFPPSIYACPECGSAAHNDGETIVCKCGWSAWANNI